MKPLRLILVYSLFVSLSTNAQNWSLVMPNDTLVYEKQDNHQFFTVWVDSTHVNGTDTTYFMNRISPGEVIGQAHDSDICNLSYYPFVNAKFREFSQAQFCGADIYVSGLKTEISFSSSRFVIFPNHPVGAQWISDSVQLDTMKIISAGTIYLSGLQIQDSIKIFEFNGNTFTLSKNHGLISSVDLRTDNGSEFKLVGIQNLGLGDVIPMFDDYSDFNVGDLFVRLTEDKDAESTFKQVFKHRITSKSILNDTLIYEYIDIKNNTAGWLKYWNDKNPILNAFPNTIAFCSPYYFNGPNYEPPSYSNVFVFRTGSGDIQKQTFYSNDFHLLAYCDTSNILVEYLSSSHYAIYQEGVEPILEGFNLELSSYRNILIGYVKDGISYGDTTSVSEIDYSQFIHIYPNPTKDYIIIETEKLNGAQVMELYDLQGRIVVTKTFETRLKLDVSTYSSGIYFTVIKDEKGSVIHRQKVVVQ